MPLFTVAQEIQDFAIRCVLPDPPDSIPNGVKIGVNAGMTQLRQQLAGRSRSSGRRTTKFVIDSTLEACGVITKQDGKWVTVQA
jgi:hypothetical protein